MSKNKINTNLIFASLINICGLMLMFGSLFTIARYISIVIPLSAYALSYKLYKEEFWKAFLISLGFLFVITVYLIGLVFKVL